MVEIIVLKLENEPSFHRRVDFWFLLDSVTQVAHTQKGQFRVSGLFSSSGARSGVEVEVVCSGGRCRWISVVICLLRDSACCGVLLGGVVLCIAGLMMYKVSAVH